MGAGHDHGTSLAAEHRGRLWAALAITTVVMVAELVGGIVTDSLSLVSDAAHMGTDALGIAMALAAVVTASLTTARPGRTFGLYRLEVIAALANTVLLLGVSIWVIVESVHRFGTPPDIRPIPMLVVGTVGLAANLVSLVLLRSGAEHSINLRGAYLEVLGDLLGSVGVVIAAAVILTTGWWYIDPIIAVSIGAFILPRAVRLGRDALHILLQNAPAHLDVTAVAATLGAVDGVRDVHDLHVWTLTSGMEVASAHLRLFPGADVGTVLSRARRALREEYRIGHATLQVEPEESTHDCHDPGW